jgi:hypothetical protein
VFPILTRTARLGSFIAMFLVLRGAMPAFQDFSERGDDAVDRTGPHSRRARIGEIFLVSIVPFFAFYAAWQLLADDTAQYAASALSKINFFEDQPAATVLNLALDPQTIAVIVLAFTGRFLLKRYALRLPPWTNLIAVYLESVWVYLTLFLISDYVGTFQAWVDSRAATHLLGDVRESVTAVFAPLGSVWSAVEWVIAETGGLVLLPLAWLTLAGIVYGRALVQPKVAIRVSNRYYARARDRVTALPAGVLHRAQDVGRDLVGRWTPLANAVVLIWRAGVLPMGIFVLAYTVLEALNGWLLFAGVRVIGPHDLQGWWMHFDDMLTFVVDVLLEPIRICLIAAAYDFCLRRLEERRESLPELTGSEPQEQVAR